jgi:hypothetical protein
MTDVYVKNVTQHDRIHGADGHAPGDYSRRHHEAAILIPSGPPLGQWVFKLVTSELRGQGVSSGEAVARATRAVRGSDPDFHPRYDPRLLEQ